MKSFLYSIILLFLVLVEVAMYAKPAGISPFLLFQQGVANGKVTIKNISPDKTCYFYCRQISLDRIMADIPANCSGLDYKGALAPGASFQFTVAENMRFVYRVYRSRDNCDVRNKIAGQELTGNILNDASYTIQ